MHPNIEKVLIDEKTLKTRIAEMAAEISKDYEGGRTPRHWPVKRGFLFYDGTDAAFERSHSD